MEFPAAKRAKVNETVNPVTLPEMCGSAVRQADAFVTVVKEEPEVCEEEESDYVPLDLSTTQSRRITRSSSPMALCRSPRRTNGGIPCRPL